MTQMSFYLSEALVAPISGAAAFIRKCTTNIWINVFSMPNLAVCTSQRKWKFQLEKCYEGLLKYYLSCIAIYDREAEELWIIIEAMCSYFNRYRRSQPRWHCRIHIVDSGYH